MESPPRHASRVIANRVLSPGAYELELERGGMRFVAGQEIQVHGDEPWEDRTYSIASGENDPALHLLYRVIPDGVLSPRLAALRPGDPLAFTGPFGSFVLRDADAPMVFIATGTGIAPAVSFLRSRPGLDATILHGVRTEKDLFYRELFSDYEYHPCISGEETHPWFRGRVTERFAELGPRPGAHYYLCGANPMILEMHRRLREAGVEEERIFSEAYYF